MKWRPLFFALLNLSEADLVVGQGGADFFNGGTVDTDGFVKDLSGDFELVSPVLNVGGDLGVDVFRVVGMLGDFFVEGGEGVEVGGFDVARSAGLDRTFFGSSIQELHKSDVMSVLVLAGLNFGIVGVETHTRCASQYSLGRGGREQAVGSLKTATLLLKVSPLYQVPKNCLLEMHLLQMHTLRRTAELVGKSRYQLVVSPEFRCRVQTLEV